LNSQELKDLMYMEKEIKRLRQRVEVLQARAESCTQQITGMPKGNKGSDIKELLIEAKDKLQKQIDAKELRKIEIEGDLDEIDDTLTRLIFTYKYADGCSWSQVARKVGGGNTKESVRKIAERYMKKRGWK